MPPGPLSVASDRPGLLDPEPRLRILAATGFALVTASLTSLPAALTAFMVALLLARGAGLRWRVLLRRLLALELFMLVLLISLPFSVPGTPWLALGPLSASHEGLVLAGLILLRANAVVLALLALLGTLEPVVFGHALGRLGVPRKLVHLLLMTARQIHLMHEELGRLRRAMRARAFVPRSDCHTWRSYGWLMGMLLVRSLARSERVMAAMRCRGFRGELHLLSTSRWRASDSVLTATLALVLTALLALDRLG